jgi:hypothetical protein
MQWDVAVNEFTEAGILVPSDRISWTGSEDPEEGLRGEGWTLHWTMEGRNGPPEKPVSANIYVEEETGSVLIDLMVLGVSSWIVCRSRLAYWLFVRDWLSRWVDLKQEEEHCGLEEAVEGFLEETADTLGELGDWLSARRRLPSVERRGQRSGSERPERGPVLTPSSLPPGSK